MQRQSLGSPSSKLHIHGGEESSVSEDQKRRVIIDDDERKDTKPRRLAFSPSSSPTSSLTSPPKHEKLIHLIPVLTLLCFLILYLTSHSPTQSGMFFVFSIKRLSSKQSYSSLIVTVCFLYYCTQIWLILMDSSIPQSI
ncbi:hypothetical protein CRYUN_Cryun12cG0010600 [Craigia yunnanensis]